MRALCTHVLSVTALLGLVIGCGTSPAPPPPAGPPTSSPATGAGAEPAGQRATGKEEAAPSGEPERRRRMRIWGEVKRVKESAHGELPEAEAVSSGGVGDPVTEIYNETQYKLTIWFAGTCAHSTEVPPGAKVTAVFCPGSYNIAAMVSDKDYLPLLRENQEFSAGMSYSLRVVIRKRPR